MNTLQFGYRERRGLQQGADRMREAQLRAGEDHRSEWNETEFAPLIESLRGGFRSSPEPEYVPPQDGLQPYLDYQAYMPDLAMLRETPAAKLFLETCGKTRLH